MTKSLLSRLIELDDVLNLTAVARWLGLTKNTWGSRKSRGSPDLDADECDKLAPELRALAKRLNTVARAMERRAKKG